LNKYLDIRADAHLSDWACWWNRDIEALVNSADQLEVEHEKRHHLGTTYEYFLRKK